MALTLEEATHLAATLMPRGDAFIDGQRTGALNSATFDTINPATGAVLARVAHCGAPDVDVAVRAARRSFEDGSWSRRAPEERKTVLLRLADLVRAHADELAVMESLDSGKTITDCFKEIGTEVPTFFQWYGEAIDKRFDGVAPTGANTLALVLREPIGVVGLVLPWNFPLLMAAWKLAPALAAGCSIVLKPAEQTPLTALRLAELALEAGLPAGVLNVVPGYGETTGQALGRHDDIDVVSFTGSTEVGGYFLRYAGESNLKVVGLEMGGKSPFIVLDDADLTDSLIEHAAMAAFWNAGQNCSANMRQIVDRKLAGTFAERVAERASRLRVGNPLDPQTEIGAIVSQDQMDRVARYIDVGRQEGARCLAGGSDMGGPGYFIRPTVFSEVTAGMTIAREEIFGPVLGVIAVDGVDEALQLAHETEYGLHATIFTQNLDRAMHFARRLRVGTVSVNGFSEGDVKTPFGGYKRSGSLARDKGLEALAQYQQTKTVWMNLNPL